MNIETKLRVEDYKLLRQRFNRSAADSAELSNKPADRAASKTTNVIVRLYFSFAGSLNKEEFIEAFDSILELPEYRTLLEKLFDKVCFNPLEDLQLF